MIENYSPSLEKKLLKQKLQSTEKCSDYRPIGGFYFCFRYDTKLWCRLKHWMVVDIHAVLITSPPVQL